MHVDRLALLLALTVTAAAQDARWSRFRGPNGTGVVDTPGLPVRFDKETNVRWRTPLPPGRSSPVLSETRVFLTAYEGDVLYTIALARVDGRELWRKRAPRDRTTQLDARNDHASPTPALNADTVVVFFQDYGLVAYDHDGAERWRRPLAAFDNIYGMGASPLIVDGRVVLPCDQQTGSYLLCVDVASGEPLWRAERPSAKSGHCTPVVHRPEGGGAQLVLPGSFYLDGYDLASGARAWWVSGLSFEMKSVPVLHDGVVYINGYGSPMNQPGNQVEVPDFEAVRRERDADKDGLIGEQEMPPSRAANWFAFVDLDGSGALDEAEWTYLRDALASQNGMLAIRAGGAGGMTQKSVAWTYRKSVPQLPSPLLYRDVLWMLNDSGGLVTTFRPQTGEVLAKGRLADAVDTYYAAPVAGDGKVYLTSEHGLVVVLPPEGGLAPLCINDLGEDVYATPAIAGGCLYLRTTLALYCFAEAR